MKKILGRSAAFLLTFGVAIGVARAANWNLSFHTGGPTAINVGWDADYGATYKVCWKVDGTGGDVCAPGHQFSVTADNNSPSYSPSSGRMGATISPLSQCGVSYKIRIKRSALAYDTETFTNPC